MLVDRIWWWIAALLILTACTPAQERQTVIHDAKLSVQGDSLYAKVEISKEQLERSVAILAQGEPVLATYQFQLYRDGGWLPDTKLSDITLKRRVRQHLIIERYELQTIGSPQVTFTMDEDEALQFLGRPRYIPLLASTDLRHQGNYRLLVRFRLEQDGVSRMLRLLNRWLVIWKSEDDLFAAEYHHP